MHTIRIPDGIGPLEDLYVDVSGWRSEGGHVSPIWPDDLRGVKSSLRPGDTVHIACLWYKSVLDDRGSCLLYVIENPQGRRWFLRLSNRRILALLLLPGLLPPLILLLVGIERDARHRPLLLK